ncbi:MAG: 6,7-dimethyl-8-ribityllumazine synthase [Alphaproteobacteria bacterium]|nr:6,7-dimethyl-8-ribityllumazine synthase [Alphaproteobacteria bacterium]
MSAPHILIIEARYYDHIADALLEGAVAELEAQGATHEKVVVPGALEVPAAVAMASDANRYDGFVVLGCVIRGETSHYDIVAGESARALQDLAITHRLAIGNGILTTENGDQAWVRADPKQKNKGKDAANAALTMISLRACFEGVEQRL